MTPNAREPRNGAWSPFPFTDSFSKPLAQVGGTPSICSTRRVSLMSKLIAKAQTSLIKRLEALREKEEGATAVEYGLIIALISIVIVTALVTLVPGIQAAIAGVVAQLPGAGS